MDSKMSLQSTYDLMKVKSIIELTDKDTVNSYLGHEEYKLIGFKTEYTSRGKYHKICNRCILTRYYNYKLRTDFPIWEVLFYLSNSYS